MRKKGCDDFVLDTRFWLLLSPASEHRMTIFDFESHQSGKGSSSSEGMMRQDDFGSSTTIWRWWDTTTALSPPCVTVYS